ncbi:MAG: PAC2 family protein [Chloroflexi bacterium]|nr:PAC2 family protein [Chloroflexota bacterium]MDA1004469.1 PAC2 family protein [Chloroflexota bacterium]
MTDSTLHSAVRPLTDLGAVGELRDPILLAAFSGAWGTTAGTALAHVIEQWGATPLAEIDAEEFFDFTAVRPTVRLEGDERVLEWPENRVYLARPEGAARDLVILAGVEPSLRWRTFADALGSLMNALGIGESLIVSSFPGGTPHTRETPLRLHGEHAEIAERLGIVPWTPEYQGPTSFGGFLAIEQHARGVRTSSLNAIAPFYIQVEPRPHAELALIRAIDRAFGTTTDLSTVETEVNALNEQALEALATSDRYRDMLATLEEQYDTAAATAATEAAAALDADEILQDVEDFFGRHGDVNGPGSGRASQRG